MVLRQFFGELRPQLLHVLSFIKYVYFQTRNCKKTPKNLSTVRSLLHPPQEKKKTLPGPHTFPNDPSDLSMDFGNNWFAFSKMAVTPPPPTALRRWFVELEQYASSP